MTDLRLVGSVAGEPLRVLEDSALNDFRYRVL